MSEEEYAAVLHAMMDLRALTTAEDWMEICGLKSAAADTLQELIDAFEEPANELRNYFPDDEEI